MQILQYIQEQFETALKDRKPGETNADIFERVITLFEIKHGFESPYQSYNSLKSIKSKQRKNRLYKKQKVNSINLLP